MSLHEILPELLKLTPEEMVQAIEVLQRQIADQQHISATPATNYEIWSPQITPETARQLLDLLQNDTAKHG